MIGGLIGEMGGGFTGGSSGASTANGPLNPDTTAGNVSNGGITINQAWKFDPSNPVHLAGAGLAGVVAFSLLVKVFK